eukprot:gene23195-7738_t
MGGNATSLRCGDVAAEVPGAAAAPRVAAATRARGGANASLWDGGNASRWARLRACAEGGGGCLWHGAWGAAKPKVSGAAGSRHRAPKGWHPFLPDSHAVPTAPWLPRAGISHGTALLYATLAMYTGGRVYPRVGQRFECEQGCSHTTPSGAELVFHRPARSQLWAPVDVGTPAPGAADAAADAERLSCALNAGVDAVADAMRRAFPPDAIHVPMVYRVLLHALLALLAPRRQWSQLAADAGRAKQAKDGVAAG